MTTPSGRCAWRQGLRPSLRVTSAWQQVVRREDTDRRLSMTILKAPAGTLTDGTVELRLPSPESDIVTINQYVDDEQLDGGWLPDVPLVTAERLVKDWLDCWNGHPDRSDAAFTFVVTVPEEPRFIGVVSVTDREDGAFDIAFGIAPVRPRRRGDR
jgi:hypothetical protein